ncbi:MAG: Gmad2 immunoglobulin-like domain-containing protein [Patescibacteria group bacterium]|jgi:hypothetical protein
MKKTIIEIIITLAVIGAVIAGYCYWPKGEGGTDLGGVALNGFEDNQEFTTEETPNKEAEQDNKEIADKSDLIQVYSPQAGQIISSPLMIYGQARGNWYFEGDFPVVLTDWDGKIIGQGHATAQGEWMTEEFVPFSAELEFIAPTLRDNGTLILRKDNPSGLPENDDALEIPVLFKTEKVISLEENLRKMLAAEHNWDINLMEVNISQMSDNHARGGVMFFAKENGEPGEGGYLYASDINGEWEIVAQGNGQISCELLDEYNFPEDMKDQCS